jgi:hypothetical protein
MWSGTWASRGEEGEEKIGPLTLGIGLHVLGHVEDRLHLLPLRNAGGLMRECTEGCREEGPGPRRTNNSGVMTWHVRRKMARMRGDRGMMRSTEEEFGRRKVRREPSKMCPC